MSIEVLITVPGFPMWIEASYLLQNGPMTSMCQAVAEHK
jgi:hypothetical protein